MQKIKTLSCRIGAVLLLAAVLLGAFLAAFPLRAMGAVKPVYIDETSIQEDFEAFGINTALYPAKDNAKRQIIYFIESCYSKKYSGQDHHYGLYIWVYNPTCTPIIKSGNNDVNISADGGKSFNDVDLKEVGHSADHLYYKFCVQDDQITALLSDAREYAKTHDDERSYKIGGIELQVVDGTVHDSEVEKEFIFTGYARGCDESAQEASTLEMKTAGLETIHLSLEHTTYRAEASYEGWYRDAIHTVYFALPKVYLTQYGNLQKIKAEWDEYKTKEIFVTSSGQAEDELYPYIGKDLLNGLDESLTHRVLWDYYFRDRCYFTKGYNDLKENDGVFFSYTDAQFFGYSDGLYGTTPYSSISRFDWLFFQSEDEIKNEKPISSKVLEEYMAFYTAAHGGDLVAGNRYSAALFLDELDSDRQEKFDADGDHHIVQEFDADAEIEDFHVSAGILDAIFGDGVSSVEGILPIEVISSLSEINGLSEEGFEEKYFVENDGGSTGNVLSDVKKILNHKDSNGNNDMCVVLFRFAVTDYYSSPAYFNDTDAFYGADGSKSLGSVNGYVAQETVFLNFDVISLSFKTADEGNKLKVIPVVADPIDVIPSLVPPAVNEELEWLELIVRLNLLIILFVFVMPIISPILGVVLRVVGTGFKVVLKGALWVLLIPWKLLRLIFRRRR